MKMYKRYCRQQTCAKTLYFSLQYLCSWNLKSLKCLMETQSQTNYAELISSNFAYFLLHFLKSLQSAQSKALQIQIGFKTAANN